MIKNKKAIKEESHVSNGMWSWDTFNILLILTNANSKLIESCNYYIPSSETREQKFSWRRKNMISITLIYRYLNDHYMR